MILVCGWDWRGEFNIGFFPRFWRFCRLSVFDVKLMLLIIFVAVEMMDDKGMHP
jgi:hypothetical protein